MSIQTPKTLAKAAVILGVTQLFTACATNDMVDARLSFKAPVEDTNNQPLKYGEIKSYTLTGVVPEHIVSSEDPRNQQDVYGDLVLDYRAENYTLDNAGYGTLENSGLGGEQYNLYAPSNEAPTNVSGLSGMGSVLKFDNLNTILSSSTHIASTDFNTEDGFTVYLSGYLTCNAGDLASGPNLENMFQIGTDSGVYSNRAPVVISQHATDQKSILARSAGKGGSLDYQEIGCNQPSVIIHRSEGNGGAVETVILNKSGSTYLDQATWYSSASNVSPDSLRHDSARMDLVTPLSGTNGIISIGGNPDIANSRASFNLKSLQFYNQAHDLTRSMLISAWSAEQLKMYKPRMLLASMLTNEYLDVDFSTIVHVSRVESENTRRTEAIAYYNENSSFLTLESDITTEDPVCITDVDNRFVPFWLADANAVTTNGKQRCVDTILPWFGDIKMIATHISGNSSKESTNNSLSTYESYVASQPIVNFNMEGLTGDTVEAIPNTLSVGDPNEVTRSLIEAYQLDIEAQPTVSFLVDDVAYSHHINSRQAISFDGVNDSMVVQNLSESNVSMHTLATEGFVYSAVIQLGEHGNTDNTFNTVLRFGGVGIPVFHIRQDREDSSVLDFKDAGTTVPDIETNNLPVALTVHSAPVTHSSELGYGAGKVTVFVNGEEIKSRVNTNWNNVDPDGLMMSIGAKVDNDNGVKINSYAPMNVSQIGLWVGHTDYNAKIAKVFSDTLTQSFGITVRGTPDIGPRAIANPLAEPYLKPIAQ